MLRRANSRINSAGSSVWFASFCSQCASSSAGGVQPQWSHDGSELFYLALDGQLVAVPVVRSVVGQPFDIGKPAELFRMRVAAVDDVAMRQFIVSKDATRFLLDTVVEEAPSPITVILNWKPPDN